MITFWHSVIYKLVQKYQVNIKTDSENMTVFNGFQSRCLESISWRSAYNWSALNKLFCRTDVEAETPIIWPPDAKSWLIGKDPDAGKDWGQEEKGTTEDEIIGWHHWLNGHEFEQALGVGDDQGSLVCCSSRGHKESDTTEQLNWTECRFQCHFFSWPHPLLLPLCPQVCSLCLHLYCCTTNMFISTIFLDSIYMH